MKFVTLIVHPWAFSCFFHPYIIIKIRLLCFRVKKYILLLIFPPTSYTRLSKPKFNGVCGDCVAVSQNAQNVWCLELVAKVIDAPSLVFS